MEPPGPPSPGLSSLRIDILRRAVDIYLQIAYPGVEPPEAVRRRLVWPEDVDAAQLLTHLPFERANRPDEGGRKFNPRGRGNPPTPHRNPKTRPGPNPPASFPPSNPPT